MADFGAAFLRAMGADGDVTEVAGATVDRLWRGLRATLGGLTDVDELFGLRQVSEQARVTELGGLLGGWVPRELGERLSALLMGKDVPEPVHRSLGAGQQRPDAALAEIARQLSGEFGAPGTVALMTAVADLPEVVREAVTAAMPPPGSRWDPIRVARIIREHLVKWLVRLQSLGLLGEHTRKVLAEIDTEILGSLQLRVLTAAALGIALTELSELGDIIGAPSSLWAGTEVHERLQEEYRRDRPGHTLVQESWVYRNGFGRPLKSALREDYSLLALWWARDRQVLALRKATRRAGGDDRPLRDDNLDLTVGQIWEIKPVRSAPAGVVQEFAYRSLFNIAVAVLRDVPGLPALLGMGGGKPLRFSCEHLRPGTMAAWPEALGRILVLTSRAARDGGRTIFVTMVDPLPGMVLYLRTDLPPALLTLAAAALVDDLNRLTRRLNRKIKKLLAVTAVAAVAAVAVLAVAAALYLAVVLLPAMAVVEAVEAVAAGLAAIGARLPQLLDALRRIQQQITPLVQEFGLTLTTRRNHAENTLVLRFDLREGTLPDQVPRTAARVGTLHFENCPLAVLATLQDVMALAAPLAAASLHQSIPRRNA